MTLTVVIDEHTYEGQISASPKSEVRYLHVRGPIEWKRPRCMRGTYNLDEMEWVRTPGRANLGGSLQKEFMQAGWRLVEMTGE